MPLFIGSENEFKTHFQVDFQNDVACEKLVTGDPFGDYDQVSGIIDKCAFVG